MRPLALLLVLQMVSMAHGCADTSTAPGLVAWKVHGVVSASASGMPVEGAAISIEIFPPVIPGAEERPEATFEVVTDSDGTFVAVGELTRIGSHRVRYQVTAPPGSGLDDAEGERSVEAFPESATDTTRVELNVTLTP